MLTAPGLVQTKKQEAFEEQLKFSTAPLFSPRSHAGVLILHSLRTTENHFRALDEEEISFLDSIVEDNQDEERERKKLIQDELRAYRE